MNKIFIKNFKGFNNQIIELEDVNFLVGENSTGKTSLINLINILSSQEFWFNAQFNNSEIEMGYFDEILSKNSKEQTFQIGTERIATQKVSKVTKDRKIRILFEFKSSSSIPKISWMKFSANDLNVLIKPTLKTLICTYNFENGSNFDNWINEGFNLTGETINVDLPILRFPVPLIFQLVSNEINERTKKSKEYSSFDDGIFYKNYTWLAPIRAKAKRIYESYNIKFSPEGDHIPSLLKSLLESTKNRKRVIEILERFGKESNLFDTIEIKELGDKNISPFEILIKYNNHPIKLPNVGYGVSQILPIIVEILATKKTMFSIQQPEVHLHPKAQSAFGHFLFKACEVEEHKFLIETHSDFTINKFRYILSQSQAERKFSTQILFFERTKEGNNISHLKINKTGNFIEPVPESYTDFFIDEELKLLEL